MPDAEESIDAVYLWVDGQAPGFAETLKAASAGEDRPPDPLGTRPERFRDNGELRYSLRSLEMHAPWIRNVHIVTNGQVPHWLDTENARIRLVEHREIFTDPRCLPTFNSNAIELQLHRIPDLSRRFVYMNDDMFLGRDCALGDFSLGVDGRRMYFQNTALPDRIDEGSVHDRAYAYTIDLMYQNRSRQVRRLLPAHVPLLYDKEIIDRLEHDFPEAFAQTSGHRFRTDHDLVLRILYLFSQLEQAGGEREVEAEVLPEPSERYMFARLEDDTSSIAVLERIGQARPRFFCVNDDLGEVGSEHVTLCALRYLLQKMFPERSYFERSTPSASAVFQREMWNQRLRGRWDLEGVGHLELGHEWNRHFYRVRRKVFHDVVRKLGIDVTGAWDREPVSIWGNGWKWGSGTSPESTSRTSPWKDSVANSPR